MAIYQQELDNMIKWDGSTRPFVECYQLFFHHPQSQKSFLFKYSLLVPERQQGPASGNVEFFCFDTEPNMARYTAKVQDLLLDQDIFYFQIHKNAAIYNAGCRGKLENAQGMPIEWELKWEHAEQSLLLFPKLFYMLPKLPLMALVPNPELKLQGFILLGKQKIEITHCLGSQGHYYGRNFPERYLWCEILDDTLPKLQLQILCLEYKLSKKIKPVIKSAHLKVAGVDYHFNQWTRLFYNQSRFDAEGLLFVAERGQHRLELEISSSQQMFAFAEANVDGSKLYHHLDGQADLKLKLLVREGRDWKLQTSYEKNKSVLFYLVEPYLDQDVKLLG